MVFSVVWSVSVAYQPVSYRARRPQGVWTATGKKNQEGAPGDIYDSEWSLKTRNLTGQPHMEGTCMGPGPLMESCLGCMATFLRRGVCVVQEYGRVGEPGRRAVWHIGRLCPPGAFASLGTGLRRAGRSACPPPESLGYSYHKAIRRGYIYYLLLIGGLCLQGWSVKGAWYC